jgi:hypothetical protein
MDESSNESSGAREPQQPESAKSSAADPAAAGTPAAESAAEPSGAPDHPTTESKANNKMLPVVWSPRLGANEDITEEFFRSDAEETVSASADPLKEESSETAGHSAGDAPLSRSMRFALLAASVACAAAFGSFAGSLSATGIAHLWPADIVGTTSANGPLATKAELAELAAIKAGLEGAARNANAQLTKLADRLDRVEHAQSEPAAKLAHISEALDRLEKKGPSAAAAAPETTGTVSSTQPPAPIAATLPERIVQDWIVEDVRNGHALVQNRYGGVFAVAAGSILPGLGKVETIKRQDGQWIVVTAHGVITSGP